MRLTTEKMLKDIKDYLEETAELPWGNAHIMLEQAKDLIESQRKQLRHLEKMVVWHQDITMTGINSEEYENGFWDAVNYVKTIQSQHGLYGMN